MHNTTMATLCTVTGLAGAYWFNRKKPAKVISRVTARDAILADLPTNPANLYYLARPPWMIVPIRAFRSDDKDFPRAHRYRDPQGPLADIYNPTKRGN